MSEDSPGFPHPVPTNHGHFEGPATEQDYREAQQIDAQRLAQLLYQQRRQRAELSKREEDKLDEITGLPYGASFRRIVNDRLEKLDPHERRRLVPNNAIIVHGDGKGLKHINDTLGHENGNVMLRNIGHMFKALARPDDLVGRWGESSDEFGAVYFFRDDQITPEEMKKVIDEGLLELAKYAAANQEIGGLRWSSTFFEPGKDFRYHLSKAEPVESINPGNVIEWPPRDVMPNRDDHSAIIS